MITLKTENSQIAGFIFTVILGTLLHFTYQWSDENVLVGTFSAVNESMWEHLKLLIVPMLIFGVVEYFKFGRDLSNFLPVRFISILLGIAVIIGAVNIYMGIIGKHFLLVDILIFIGAVYAAYRFSFQELGKNKYASDNARRLAIIGIIFLVACTVIFTFYPPEINLFMDPRNGSYGIFD